jgi:hypothetical protein
MEEGRRRREKERGLRNEERGTREEEGSRRMEDSRQDLMTKFRAATESSEEGWKREE